MTSPPFPETGPSQESSQQSSRTRGDDRADRRASIAGAPFLSARVDPYPLYARLHAEAPVLRTGDGLWVLARHADVAAVLRDPRCGREGFERHFGADAGGAAGGARACPAAGERARPTMLFRDPPAHTRLREAVSHAFTPRAVEAWRPRIRRLAETLLDRAGDRAAIDLVGALAAPLPRAVMGELLGIPEAHQAPLGVWAGRVARSLDALPIPEDRPLLAEGQAARRCLGGYFRELAAARRHDPGPDLLSGLIRVADEDGLLTDRELIAMAVLLLVAGTETTTSLIATTVWALLQHPAALAQVREAPWRLPAVIEEAARWESPVQRTWRIANADLRVGGHRIPAGALIVPLIGAANRDPARWPAPERFDPARRAAGHLAFGAGVHACLGATLARLETQVAVEAFLRRWPRVELATAAPAWRPAATLRALAALPVTR